MAVTRKILPIQPEIRLIGDWQRAHDLLGTLDTTLAFAVKKGQKAAANKFKELIKKNIRENGSAFGWPALSDSYKSRKAKKGFDSNRILYMSGTYYKNIMVWGMNGRYYVGLKKHTRNPFSGGHLTLGQIARVLEYGSDKMGIKARPLWVPTFRQFGGTKRINNIIAFHIRREIYKRYAIKAKVSI